MQINEYFPHLAPRILGEVVLLQVQASSLKLGERPHQRYTTKPLLRVAELELSEGGVRGIGAEPMLDVHHRFHPASKNRGGKNGISIGFTSHYDLLFERFCGSVTLGCAGENIIVSSVGRVDEVELAGGAVLVSPAGLVRSALTSVEPIAPCSAFARFLLEDEDPSRETLQHTLGFLRSGLRGYYCSHGEGATAVRLGDMLVVPTRR